MGMFAFEELIEAKTVRAVTDVIEKLQSRGRIRWHPVGDRENNLATVNIGSDPAAALVERITNAIDAVVEREWEARGCPGHLRSPRAAVEEWFGIREGRLKHLDDHAVRSQKVVELSNRVRVTLWESERPDRPTIDIRDFGIGLLPAQFRETILSLNATRKLRKFFLAGAFGQGGSVALGYSIYTVIVSRRAPTRSGESHPVAATIVRFNPGNLETDKHGLYEYVVDASTGNPFILNVDNDTFPPGTLVRHVQMDLHKYNKIMTALTNSLWYLAHHYLFDPILPFRIEEQRNNQSKGEARFVGGNHRRLTRGEYTAYQRQADRTFRAGSVVVTWWVLDLDGPRDRITEYCLASRPIIITYNGQKQGDLPNTVIRDDLQLAYLDRYLVVHVDCDRLDNESRRQLFPTTRENLRDTSLLGDLRRLVVETLSGDDELRRLNEEKKRRYIRSGESQSAENLRRRLANRVKAAIRVQSGGTLPGVLPPGEVVSPEPRPPIPVQDPPTFLEITGPDPKHVYPGRSFLIRFRTDADPSYFHKPDGFIAVINPPQFGQFTGTTTIHNGYGTAYFRVHETTQVGERAEVTLELRPPHQRSVRDCVTVEATAPPAAGGDRNGSALAPNINPQWVARGDSFWVDQGWDESAVAKVIRGGDSVDVFVSHDNARFSRLLARAQTRGNSVTRAIEDFYLEHIAFHAVIADLSEEANRAQEGSSDTSPSVDLEALRERELRRACETVCGIIEQLFDFFTTTMTEASEPEE